VTASGAFSGFRPAAFEFLAGLRDNNDPAWFKPRKAVYDSEVLAPFRRLISALSEALAAVGVPLVGDPDRSIFRLYRDVRFSADKRLYKTHAAAVLTRSGSKRDPGLLYLHVEPGRSLAAVGFWHAQPPLLARLRAAILDDPDGFLRIASELEALGYTLSCEDERLTRPPRGLEAAKGTPVEDFVCWKNFIAEVALDDAEMQSPALVGRVVDFALATQPLLQWGWAAGDADIPPPLTLKLPTRPLPRPDF
jgi:uncharacterized protein (TIGR02453 family)